MATRSGDLDPGLLLYLLRAGQADADSLEQMLNHNAGLTGISGGESDLRALEAAAAKGNAKAQLAIDIFCTQIREVVASYAAVLDGLDLLVFTGGIGEHSGSVRKSFCRHVGFLGISLDSGSSSSVPESNPSTSSGRVQVRVIGSEEDRQIARHTRSMSSS